MNNQNLNRITRYLILGFICIVQLATFGQNKIITGRLTDINGHPLAGVSICQSNIENCNHSDSFGIFHITIDKNFDRSIDFSHYCYKTVHISNIDTISSIMNIVLDEDTCYSDIIYPRVPLKYGFISFLQVDFIFNDFTDFKPLLTDYNIDLMNISSGILSFELAGTYKRFYTGLNYGFADDGFYEHDSLEIIFNTNQFGFHFGYNLLNTKRILFTPKVAIKWNRYRLLNYDKHNRIPIEQYVEDRDLDIRFNQITGFVGFNLSYKIYKYNLFPTDYWTVGVYGGYAFKLNEKPWMYSHGNRLTSIGKIGMKNYNIGVNFSFNFDGQ